MPEAMTYAATRVAPRELPDYLLAHGRPVVTLAEAAELLGASTNDATSALVRLRRAGRMFSPRPGLYVAVPPQYRTWGSPPAMDFIDPTMRAAGRNYYVALLSAAEHHGAAHQRPQVFQVLVDVRLPDRDFGRVKVRFYQSQYVGKRPTVRVNTGTGQAQVSTPEVTLLDLVTDPAAGAGLSNVATVAGELVEDAKLDAQRLAQTSATYPVTTLRRTGWLLDLLSSEHGFTLDTEPLHRVLTGRSKTSRAGVPVDAGGARRGHTDARWGVVENTHIEPDL